MYKSKYLWVPLHVRVIVKYLTYHVLIVKSSETFESGLGSKRESQLLLVPPGSVHPSDVGGTVQPMHRLQTGHFSSGLPGILPLQTPTRVVDQWWVYWGLSLKSTQQSSDSNLSIPAYTRIAIWYAYNQARHWCCWVRSAVIYIIHAGKPGSRRKRHSFGFRYSESVSSSDLLHSSYFISSY